jgi:hypothetical protein
VSSTSRTTVKALESTSTAASRAAAARKTGATTTGTAKATTTQRRTTAAPARSTATASSATAAKKTYTPTASTTTVTKKGGVTTPHSNPTAASTAKSPTQNPPATALKTAPAAGAAAVTASQTPARAAATKPTVTPVRATRTSSNPVAVQSVPAPAPVEERVNYQYNALGRRDPFQPLVGGGFVSADVQNAPPDVGGLKVVGIIWVAEDKFALIEDPRGNSMVLRKGDKVTNGVVQDLRRDAVVVKLTVDGNTDLVEIPLTRKGESNENR